MNRVILRLMLVAMACTLLGVLGWSIAAAQTCQDAAGGPIPCPPASTPEVEPPTATPLPTTVPPTGPDSDGDGWVDSDDRCPTQSGVGAPGRGDCPDPDGDFITNDGDVCPDQPGPAENGGCPAGTVIGATITPEPTAVPDTSTTANPLRPSTSDTCQLATATTQAVNVRAEPSLNAAVVGSLDPNTLYPVQAAAFAAGQIWYRVATGWVSASVVVIGGSDCPTNVARIIPGAFTISADEYEQTRAGIFPETRCTTLLDETRICYTVLSASADDGSTEGGTWEDETIWTCTPTFCIANEFTFYIPDDGPPEFYEPDPDSNEPQPTPDNNDDDSGEGERPPLCSDVIGGLNAAPTLFIASSPSRPGEQSAVIIIETDEPIAPCLMQMFIPQPQQGSDGRIPVDVVEVEIDFPTQSAANEPYMRYVLKDLIVSSAQPSAALFETALVDANQVVCVPTLRGDFSSCPLPPLPRPNPPLPPIEASLLLSTPVPDLPLDFQAVPLTPGPGDPTEYSCFRYPHSGTLACECNGLSDCAFMANVRCGDNEIYCDPSRDQCVCVVPGS